jgi:unsaturated chondroitin disaccharide hydrolase
MHDLGFLYSLYSVALYRLTGDQEHRTTAQKAAEELARRFIPTGGYIQAWGRLDDPDTEYAGLAIIDSMMNLPLLFWAADDAGRTVYREIALRHAHTTIRQFVRTDDSVCHAYRFELVTGMPQREENYCGFAVGSQWARGMAWAIYGFALMQRYLPVGEYLAVADRLARKFASLLDDETVPLWDFRLPLHARQTRDSSAAAIAACGLYDLEGVPGREALPGFGEIADRLLDRLCERDYLNEDPACCAVLRNAETGDGIGKATNVYASWGDYFFMQALARRLYGHQGFW